MQSKLQGTEQADEYNADGQARQPQRRSNSVATQAWMPRPCSKTPLRGRRDCERQCAETNAEKQAAKRPVRRNRRHVQRKDSRGEYAFSGRTCKRCWKATGQHAEAVGVSCQSEKLCNLQHFVSQGWWTLQVMQSIFEDGHMSQLSVQQALEFVVGSLGRSTSCIQTRR